MKASFHRYVKKIVQQTDAPEAEKEDLYEELLIHLELSYEQYMNEGIQNNKPKTKRLQASERKVISAVKSNKRCFLTGKR